MLSRVRLFTDSECVPAVKCLNDFLDQLYAQRDLLLNPYAAAKVRIVCGFAEGRARTDVIFTGVWASDAVHVMMFGKRFATPLRMDSVIAALTRPLVARDMAVLFERI